MAVIGDYVAAFSAHRQGWGIGVFRLCQGGIPSRSAHAGEALAEYLTETKDSHYFLNAASYVLPIQATVSRAGIKEIRAPPGTARAPACLTMIW